MENASKALIIAGSILIAIMIISLGIYIFKQYSSFAKKMQTFQNKKFPHLTLK